MANEPSIPPALSMADLHQAILDSANYAIVATDPTGLITIFNRAAERLLGYTPQDVVGKCTPMIWHETAEVHAEAIARGVLADPGFNIFINQAEQFGQTREYERLCITKDGRRIPVLSSVSPIRNSAGEITGYLGIATDISARKAAEQKIREENAFRRALEQSAPIALATADLDGIQTYVNEAFCKLVGWAPEDLLGKPMPRIYWHPNGDEMRRQATAQILGNRSAPSHFELLLRHRDGHSINVVCYVSPLMTGENKVTGWLAVYFDITERKRVERVLFESEARFRSSFHESASGMSLVDPEGHWLMVNRAACAITGYSEAELLQTTFQAITHPDDLDKDLAQAEQLLAGLISSYQMDKRYIHKSGRPVWIHLSVSLVRDAQNQPLYFCSQFQDVTDRKRTDEALLAAKEAAEAANSAKSAFLANISHEIRTPLNAIAGFAEALERGDLALSERQEFAETIRRNSDHLLNVLNDILDLSKIEAGKMTIELRPVPIRPLLEETCSMLHGKADSKGLKLDCDLSPALPANTVTDPTRLRQILLNLVGNAIKFTDQGSITIRAAMEGDETLKIEVVDTGIGIPEDQRGTIFQPFMQVDVSHSRRFGGTGLGLSISQRLAMLLDGTIQLDRSSERGSTFALRLPYRSPPADPAGKDEPKVHCAGRPARVLVVEDSLDSQRLLQFLLTRMNLEVALADNGQRGLAAVDAARGLGTPFDLIIMDMQMPVLDGYTTTPLLREHGYTGPIVALTANAMPEDREQCLKIGCNEFLTKPVQSGDLQQIIQRYFAPVPSPRRGEGVIPSQMERDLPPVPSPRRGEG